MKKNDKIFNKAVEKLQKSGVKASESLKEVAQACEGFKAVNINIDELSRTTNIASVLSVKENVTKEMIENAVKQVEKKEAEEWIWVKGYKGTDKDMKCRDYQFMIGVRHDMAEGAKIETCSSGFHLCTKLNDVFDYYDRKDNNRFFEVRALVRKKDVDSIGKDTRNVYYIGGIPYRAPWPMPSDSKIAAKSIEFMRELTLDEIFAGTKAEGWTDEDKKLALEIGVDKAEMVVRTKELVSIGYSEPLADYVVNVLKRYELAVFLNNLPEQPDMNTKMIILFGNADNFKPDFLQKQFHLAPLYKTEESKD